MSYSWDSSNDSNTRGGGYTYSDARKSYASTPTSTRSYATTTSSYNTVNTGTSAVHTFKNDPLKTDSPYPVVVGIDTTGSMSDWPKTFFNKLPLLYAEAVKYLPGCEISFQAINDYHADTEAVALQPAPFEKEAKLDECIGQLYPYGGGGANQVESYDIFAAYNTLMQTPKSIIKPIVIILGDEAPYSNIPEEVATQYGLETTDTEEIFRRLHDKCDVFLIRKKYFGSNSDTRIIKKWKDTALMENERILTLDDPNRVVDVILGVLGIISGKEAEFTDEITTRQTTSQVTEVMHTVQTLSKAYSKKDETQHSVGVKDTTSKTRSLI